MDGILELNAEISAARVATDRLAERLKAMSAKQEFGAGYSEALSERIGKLEAREKGNSAGIIALDKRLSAYLERAEDQADKVEDQAERIETLERRVNTMSRMLSSILDSLESGGIRPFQNGFKTDLNVLLKANAAPMSAGSMEGGQ